LVLDRLITAPKKAHRFYAEAKRRCAFFCHRNNVLSIDSVPAASRRQYLARLLYLLPFDEVRTLNSCKVILAELLFYLDSSEVIEKVKWAEPESLFRGGLSEEELVVLACFLRASSEGSVSRLGWIHDALSWFERETSLTSDDGIREVEQWNASSSALLARFSLRKGTSFWLKAVDPAESAEYRITLTLESIFPGYLPRIVSSHASKDAIRMASR
jgi:hypothetical protein